MFWVPNGTTLMQCSIEKLQLDFYKPVVKYVHGLLYDNGNEGNKDKRKYRWSEHRCSENDDDCWTISITGHSLGGGISSIVGSTLGIPVMEIVLLC